MRYQNNVTIMTLAGAALLAMSPLFASPTFASSSRSQSVHHPVATAQGHGVTKSHTVAQNTHYVSHTHGRIRAARSYGMSCVPYARAESGIVLSGNAWQWWGNAAGKYARGTTPEAGSVLSFQAAGHMRMGHVAVVARVVNAREILIDHANWPGANLAGGVSAAIPVVDVSANNDWSAVRVGRGLNGDFGSIYPTNGFIYDRPDTGTIEANRNQSVAPALALGPAPRDLRPARRIEEVAQVPGQPHRQVGLIMPTGGGN